MGAYAWCVHGWVAWCIRHHEFVDPSQIVAFCWSVFAA